MSNDIERNASRAQNSKVVEWGARIGYAANGLLHLLIGWLAVDVAMGTSKKSADQAGALRTVAQQPFGEVVLWLVAIGFVLLAIWMLTEVFTNHDKGDRAKAGGKFVGYGAVAFTAFQFVLDSGTSSKKTTRDFTATVMDWPGGQFLVGLVGLVILGIGGYHVYKGWQQKFLEDLQEHPGTWAVWAGRIGYVAKGIALIAVGVLFVIGAAKHRTGKTTGLDGALRSLQDLPAGTAVLVLIGVGIAVFGIYSFARARYART